MSKIHKLLQKAEAETLTVPYSIGFKNPDAESRAGRTYANSEPVRPLVAVQKRNLKGIIGKGLLVIAGVAVCASVALSVNLSFRILDEVIASRATLLQFASENGIQKEHIKSLEGSLSEVTAFKQQEIAQLKQVNTQLSQLSMTLDESQEKMTELVINHNALNASVEDLRTRDRVLFEKYLSMKKQLGDLQLQFGGLTQSNQSEGN